MLIDNGKYAIDSLIKWSFSGEKELWVPFDNTPYCSTTAFDGASSVLQEVYTSLKAAEIVVEQVSSFIIFVRRYF